MDNNYKYSYYPNTISPINQLIVKSYYIRLRIALRLYLFRFFNAELYSSFLSAPSRGYCRIFTLLKHKYGPLLSY